METKKKYIFDIDLLYATIHRDIEKSSVTAVIDLLMSFLFSLIAIAFAFLLLILAINHSDLPIFDQWGRWSTNAIVFMISFDILLLFYFYVANERISRKISEKQKMDLRRAYTFLGLSLFITAISMIVGKVPGITLIVYGIFFIGTIYYLSNAYVTMKSVIEEPLFRSEDMGVYAGMMDDPFTMKDDVARAELSLGVATFGFDILFTFLERVINAIIFLSVRQRRKTISESIRLFVEIGQKGPDASFDRFNYDAKVLLQGIGYIVIRSDDIVFTSKGKKVLEKVAKRHSSY